MEIFFPGRHNTKLHPIQKVLTNTHLESIPPKQCANGSSSSSLIINSSNSGGEQQLLVVVYKIHSRGKKDHAHTSYKWCTQALCFRQNWPQELPATFAATLVPTKGSGAKTSEMGYCRARHEPDYTVAQNGAIKRFGAKSGAFCLSIQSGCHYSTC